VAREETEIIARIMAAGFNHHIRDHGPDGDYASETVETPDGHSVVVTRRGVPYSVRVEQLPALTQGAPLTPGQCWAALKDHLARVIEQDLLVHQQALDADDVATAASFGALVSANRSTLAKMRELEG
jgi:hypothetical protein